MTVGGKGFWEQIGALPQDAVTAQVKVAFDAGVTFIGTANVYPTGESKSLLGEALKDLAVPRDHVVVATNVELGAEDMKALDEVSTRPPEFPGWMLEFQGACRAKPPVKS